MTDRLTLTRALEGSGMQTEAAERIATEIYDAIHDNVATKTDLDHLEPRLRPELHTLEQRIDLRFEQVERRIDGMATRLGAVVVIVAGLLFGALHLWPPH